MRAQEKTHSIRKRSVVVMAVTLLVGLLTACTSTAERAQKAAVSYMEDGKYEKAIDELSTVISKAQLDKAEEVALMINGYYLRGDCYTLLGETEKAEADYSKALDEDLRERKVDSGVTATRYLRRGLVYVQREDYEKALDCFKSGLELGDKSCEKELMRNEICCYERLNQYDQACTEAEKYASAYPEDTEMVNEYNFLVSRQKEAQGARELVSGSDEDNSEDSEDSEDNGSDENEDTY